MKTEYQLSVFGHPNFTLEQFKNCKDAREESHEWYSLKTVFLNYAHSPQLFTPGSKSSSNGKGIPSLLMVDIDDTLPLNDAIAAVQNYQHIIYTSKSHQRDKTTATGIRKAACDRYRIVLALTDPILEKSVWQATMDWCEVEFGFTNDPAVHYWMFFYPGLEIASFNATGLRIKPQTPGTWTNPTTSQDIPWQKYYTAQKGILSKRTRLFLDESAPNGQFNHELFLAATDAKDQGYTDQEFKDFYLKAETKKHQPKAYFDEVDEATIDSAFKADRKPVQAMRKPHMEKPFSSRSPGRPGGESSFSDIEKKAILEMMTEKFISDFRPEQTFTYEIIDKDKKEVMLIKNEDLIERFVNEERKKLSLSKVPSIHACREIYRLKSPALDKPVEAFLINDEEGYCLKRLEIPTNSYTNGSNTPQLFGIEKYPAWNEFLSRLSSPKAFMEWIGSALDRENLGRQCLWLYGARGEDGKSRILETLNDIFGEAGSIINGNYLKQESRFFFSTLYKKRFVVYPDCKLPSFVKGEIFRNITSADSVNVEFKGGHPFKARMTLKLAVGSNKKPSPEKRGNADLSRILMVEVSPSSVIDDPVWEKRLKNEVGFFLADCMKLYKDNVKNKGLEKIPVPETSQKLLLESADDTEESFEELSSLLVFDKKAEVSQCIERHKLIEWYNENANRFNLGPKDYPKFRDYLSSVKEVRVARDVRNGMDKKKYLGITRARNYAEVYGHAKPQDFEGSYYERKVKDDGDPFL